MTSGPPSDIDPDWLHAMRNAVNAATLATAAARSALESGNPARARQFLAESERACDIASVLLRPTKAYGDDPHADRMPPPRAGSVVD